MTEFFPIIGVGLSAIALGIVVIIPVFRRLERREYTDTIVAWSNEMLRLRAALRFYAENTNYEDGHEGTGPYGDSQGGIVDTEPPSIWNDHGEFARNILAEPFAAGRNSVENPEAFLALQARVLAEIQRERLRQDEEWGADRTGQSDLYWLAILGEEFGEVDMAVVEEGDGLNTITSDHPIYAEVIQVAAVAVAWAEAMRQRKEQGA